MKKPSTKMALEWDAHNFKRRRLRLPRSKDTNNS